MKRAMLVVLGLMANLAWGQNAPADSVGEAKAAITAIWEATQAYYWDKGEWPDSLKALTDSGHYKQRTFPPYLTIPPHATELWDFELYYGGPPVKIRALSKTRGNYDGEAWLSQFDYDVAAGRWRGVGIPEYERDTLTFEQKAELVRDAKNALGAISEAAVSYHQNMGDWPQTVEALAANSYVMVQPSVFRQWQLAIVGTPPQTIIAISTKEMPGGAGRGIEYDVEQKTCRGYGIGK